MIRIHVLAILLSWVGVASNAQTHMRIHHKGGGHSDVPIEQIDSITFIDWSDLPDNEASLVGSWLWGDVEGGYYELLTFNEDKTYTGYDNLLYVWLRHDDIRVVYADGQYAHVAIEWLWV